MDAEAAVRSLVEDQIGEFGDCCWDWLAGLTFHGEEPDWASLAPEEIADAFVNEFGMARRYVKSVRRAHRSPHGPLSADAMRPAETPTSSGRVAYPRPPAWWRQMSRQMMEEYRPAQALVWSLVGIAGPLALAETEEFLRGVVRLERQSGERRVLVYPAPESAPGLVLAREMEVRSGWTRAELNADGLGREWSGRRAQPLTYVSERIESIADRTGCTEAEVSAFLLCDVALRLPWVDYDFMGEGPPAQIAPAITLTIGTPEVPAADVRQAYLFAADFLRGMRAKQSGNKVRRKSRKTTWELVAFVEERCPEMSWNAIFPEWSGEHPEKTTKGYHKSMESMRAAYYRAPMRRKGVAR